MKPFQKRSKPGARIVRGHILCRDLVSFYSVEQCSQPDTKRCLQVSAKTAKFGADGSIRIPIRPDLASSSSTLCSLDCHATTQQFIAHTTLLVLSLLTPCGSDLIKSDHGCLGHFELPALLKGWSCTTTAFPISPTTTLIELVSTLYLRNTEILQLPLRIGRH